MQTTTLAYCFNIVWKKTITTQMVIFNFSTVNFDLKLYGVPPPFSCPVVIFEAPTNEICHLLYIEQHVITCNKTDHK